MFPHAIAPDQIGNDKCEYWYRTCFASIQGIPQIRMKGILARDSNRAGGKNEKNNFRF